MLVTSPLGLLKQVLLSSSRVSISNFWEMEKFGKCHVVDSVQFQNHLIYYHCLHSSWSIVALRRFNSLNLFGSCKFNVHYIICTRWVPQRSKWDWIMKDQRSFFSAVLNIVMYGMGRVWKQLKVFVVFTIYCTNAWSIDLHSCYIDFPFSNGLPTFYSLSLRQNSFTLISYILK